MKQIIITVFLISFMYLVHGQKVKIMADHADEIEHYQPGIDQTIGNSFVDNRNINERNGTKLQDYKRSVVVIFTFSGGKWRRGSGVLLNTVENAFISNDRKYYILTANHVDKNDLIFISFNYEMAHGVNRGNDVTDRNITKVYRIPIANKKLDPGSDLALLEVDIDAMLVNPETYEDPEEVFYNAYASGWDLNPKFVNEDLANISHPRGDAKKMFVNPGQVNFLSNYYAAQHDLRNKKVIEFVGPWDGASFQQRGSSGSGLIDKYSGSVLAVCIAGTTRSGIELGKSRFSSITNSWIDHGDISGFNHFLDPNHTWISTIKGGYHKDLIANGPTVDFDFTTSNNSIEKNIGTLNAIDFFRFESDLNPNEQILGDGILVAESETLGQDQAIVLTLNADNDDLLYEATYNAAAQADQTTVFKGKSNNTFLSARVLLKSQLMQHLREANRTGTFATGLERLSTFSIDHVKMGLQTNTGSVKVRAVKLPYMMPYNAREIFERTDGYDPYKDLWRSNKYPESRGVNSESLHIDRITVELKAYLYNEGAQCDELDWATLQDISTGDNGGYLNLVNSNYQIDNVLASDSRCSEQNQLRITLYTSSNTMKHFGSWVDYDGEVTHSSYSFDNATSIHTEEENPSGNEDLVILHDVPYQDDLNFEHNTLKARYRVGIANTALPLDGRGTYTHGEIEDYSLHIKQNTSLTRKDWLKVSGADIVMTSVSTANDQCLPDGTDTGTGNDGIATPHLGVDETIPLHQLPLYGIGTGVCYDLLDQQNTYIGANALKFNGQVFMDVAQGSAIVHNIASEKTVSIDFMVDNSSTNLDEVLFEEGGGANGLSILRNNNLITYGVKINDQLVEITSSTPLMANQMMNVTTVFDDGVMDLYINGAPEASSSVFAGQNITSIPEHLDDAALGATTGSGIWSMTVDNFNGVVDYFAYWTTALTPAMIALVATPVSQNTGSRPQKPLAVLDDVPETSFSVFPNPASDHLNILIEVRKAGPLNVMIVDLQGKQVYHMTKPSISEGHQLITLGNLNLAAGSYVLLVQAGDVVRREKILIE